MDRRDPPSSGCGDGDHMDTPRDVFGADFRSVEGNCRGLFNRAVCASNYTPEFESRRKDLIAVRFIVIDLINVLPEGREFLV
jgi:hypothetical protein